jgi:RNA-binding protein
MMTELTQSQRTYLRKLANPLKPTVILGKQGLTEQILGKINQELEAHELIKLRFLEHKDEKQRLTETILAETGAALVGLIGNVAIIFRPAASAEHRQIVLPAGDAE